MKKEDRELGYAVLALLCWILPLAGLVFGPGTKWQYVVWLVGGTIVLAVYDRLLPEQTTGE